MDRKILFIKTNVPTVTGGSNETSETKEEKVFYVVRSIYLVNYFTLVNHFQALLSFWSQGKIYPNCMF